MHILEAHFNITMAALRSILPLDAPADVALGRFFRDNAQLGPQDRHFIAETVFAILRRYRFLQTLCADHMSNRRLLLAALVRVRGYSLKDIEHLARGDELDWLKKGKAIELSALPLAIQAEVPDWLWDKLSAQYGAEQALALCRAWQQSAGLDIRVNTIKAQRDTVLARLQAEGIDCLPTPYSPVGIRLAKKIALNRHPLFLEGAIEVQDEGSQLLSLLLAPKRQEMVVDFCAGAGGKTLHLGAMMLSQGRLYAFDISEKRLNNLKPRLKRSGLSNVTPQLLASENDIKIKRLAGKINKVLVDAPCSGLGTLRRNPDLKWRQSAQGVAELIQKQTRILQSAANLLKIGGRIVYATCSVLEEENTQIVEAFLSKNPQFQRVPVSDILAQLKIDLPMAGDYLQLDAINHGTDGFFAAILERTASS